LFFPQKKDIFVESWLLTCSDGEATQDVHDGLVNPPLVQEIAQRDDIIGNSDSKEKIWTQFVNDQEG
jgi:hypothetical protein